MLLAEKKDGRNRWNRWKNERLGHAGSFPGKSHVECHSIILWHFFTRVEIILGVCEVSGNPSNKKVAAATAQPAQKQDKTWKKQSWPNASCWKEDARNRGNSERLGHVGATSRKEPCWMWFCGASTGEEIILGVCEMSGNPSNKKVAAATTQPAQKQDKTWKNNHDQMLLAEKKMEEIEGTMKGWDMLWPLPGKSHVECHAVGFPPGKKLF